MRRDVALRPWLALAAVILVVATASCVWADGIAVPPGEYKGVAYEGSIEERSQEAILIFQGSRQPGGAREDLILRISVEGETEDAVDHFAWVIPFPNEPKVAREDGRLFEELYDYVEARTVRPRAKSDGAASDEAAPAAGVAEPVTVLSRQLVGSFDVAVVRENQPEMLNGWLEENGYQPLLGAGDVLDFYREKNYVFACVKVDDAQLRDGKAVDLHPLRFSFATGGRDGIYFPMKMTGLQAEPFDVNLYVFYKAWINDHLSKFGYEHRGFRRKYRDWDSPQCKPNAGKVYSTPEQDPFLRDYAQRIPTVAKLFQKLHPGQRYYLTNIQAHGLQPANVRDWSDDLWLFPYYTDRSFVPYDVRAGGPASAAWPGEEASSGDGRQETAWKLGVLGILAVSVGGLGLLTLLVFAAVLLRRRRPIHGDDYPRNE